MFKNKASLSCCLCNETVLSEAELESHINTVHSTIFEAEEFITGPIIQVKQETLDPFEFKDDTIENQIRPYDPDSLRTKIKTCSAASVTSNDEFPKAMVRTSKRIRKRKYSLTEDSSQLEASSEFDSIPAKVKSKRCSTKSKIASVIGQTDSPSSKSLEVADPSLSQQNFTTENISNLFEAFGELKQQMQEIRTQNDKLSTENKLKQLSEENDNLKKRLAELTSKDLDFKAAGDTIVGIKLKLKDHNRLKAEVDRLNEKCKGLENSKNLYTKTMKAAQADLEKKLIKLSEKSVKLENENNDLKEQNKVLQTDLNLSKKQVEETKLVASKAKNEEEKYTDSIVKITNAYRMKASEVAILKIAEERMVLENAKLKAFEERSKPKLELFDKILTELQSVIKSDAMFCNGNFNADRDFAHFSTNDLTEMVVGILGEHVRFKQEQVKTVMSNANEIRGLLAQNEKMCKMFTSKIENQSKQLKAQEKQAKNYQDVIKTCEEYILELKKSDSDLKNKMGLVVQENISFKKSALKELKSKDEQIDKMSTKAKKYLIKNDFLVEKLASVEDKLESAEAEIYTLEKLVQKAQIALTELTEDKALLVNKTRTTISDLSDQMKVKEQNHIQVLKNYIGNLEMMKQQFQEVVQTKNTQITNLTIQMKQKDLQLDIMKKDLLNKNRTILNLKTENTS